MEARLEILIWRYRCAGVRSARMLARGRKMLSLHSRWIAKTVSPWIPSPISFVRILRGERWKNHRRRLERTRSDYAL